MARCIMETYIKKALTKRLLRCELSTLTNLSWAHSLLQHIESRHLAHASAFATPEAISRSQEKNMTKGAPQKRLVSLPKISTAESAKYIIDRSIQKMSVAQKISGSSTMCVRVFKPYYLSKQEGD